MIGIKEIEKNHLKIPHLPIKKLFSNMSLNIKINYKKILKRKQKKNKKIKKVYFF